MPGVHLSGYFITGSDTGVGKTRVACQLIGQLHANGNRVKVRKPVESGCEKSADSALMPADGEALNRANGNREPLDIVTPLRLRAPLAPDRAARLEGRSLTLAQLIEAATRNVTSEDMLVVEGAGGFYSPIADDALNADLARALGLKVIIVVIDRLGAINQALLTVNAVRCEGLAVSAVILNRIDETHDAAMNNLDDLSSRLDVPVYQCMYNGKLPELQLPIT